jgi:tetratricopeptide (TPR) repeat protein
MLTLGQFWVVWIGSCATFAATSFLRLAFFDPRIHWRWITWFIVPGFGALVGGVLGGVQLATAPSADLNRTHPLYVPLAVAFLLFASVALGREVQLLPARQWARRLARAQRDERPAAILAACDHLLGLPGVTKERVWTHKAVTLLGLDRYGEALTACDQALALAPESSTWALKALVAASGRRREDAAAAYTQARTLTAFHTSIEWGYLGYVAQILGRPDEALAACAQAVAHPNRTPTNTLVTALASRATALNDLGHYQEALAAAEQALAQVRVRVSVTARFPVRSQVARAIALAHLQEPTAAREAAEHALAGVDKLLAERPGFIEAQEGRGVLLRLLGHQESGGHTSAVFAAPPGVD